MKYELLGRIVKLHGCEGAVAVKVERRFFDNIPGMESVFLEIEGRKVPFFITDNQLMGHENIILWLDGYDSVEKVKEFNGCRIYISTNKISAQADSDETDITGFEIFTKDDGVIGIIRELTENNGQLLLNVISGGGKEILIPLHGDLIVDIDEKGKRIEMSLPEGLITLN